MLAFVQLAAPVYAETATERYNRLKGELAEINQMIADYKNDRSAAQKLKAALVEQKALLDEMIEAKKQEIADTGAQLAQKEQEIAQKRESIYENDQLYQQRLVAIYKMNDSNMLANFLAVESVSEFMDVVKNLRIISYHDTSLLALLNSQRQQLEAEQEAIDALLEELTASYADLEADAAALAESIQAQDAAISAANAQIAAQQQAYNSTYTDLAAAQAEMAAISNSAKGSTSGDGSQYVGGQLIWPVPGFYSISCQFGEPDPNGKAHRGMDVRGSGITGAAIVAAGKGKVIAAAHASSYGNYIIIDHGAGIRTLYAHCSALWVGAGTQVDAGTAIAAVGSTGFVTGPHLHFEVQLNGVPQNPLAYLKA